MSDFPALSGLGLIKALRSLGFIDMRQSRGLLSQILRDCEITIEELRACL